MLGIGNRETELIAEVERLELSVRMTRRRVEHARTEADKRALNRQLGDMITEMDHLRRALRPMSRR